MTFTATEICRALSLGNMPRTNTAPIACASVFQGEPGDWRYQINMETSPYCQGVGFESKPDAYEYLGDALILLGERGYETELAVDSTDGFVPDRRQIGPLVAIDGA